MKDLKSAKESRKADLRTPTALSEQACIDIAAEVNALLADTFAIYMKTKNFHWHMSGPHFRDFHLLLDEQADQIYATTDAIAERVRKLGRTTMMVLAVTLHNIPEGMAVGVMYAGFLAGGSQITAASALALSLGIAIQNFPEGAIISMPLRAEGESKGRAFWGGVLSGVVEPVGAVLTILAAQLVIPALPYFLSFAAGAMLYVVVEELIPEMSQGRHSNLGTVFFAVGFSVMMVLDVALG